MTIRFRSSLGEFLLHNPEVGASSRGPYFNARYQSVERTGYVWPDVGHYGHFLLRDATLIEPVPGEQLELEEAA